MNPDAEIQRLRDLMPASGRMLTKIQSKPQQTKVIETPFPVPWKRSSRLIYINFDLWRELRRSHRDLILLREVSWLIEIKWFQPDLYQGATVAGLVGTIFEVTQADTVGVLVAGGLTAIAFRQLWRSFRSPKREIDADEAAIKVASRRGYNSPEAAEALLNGIEAIAKLEGRSVLTFTELLRTQQLKTKLNLSSVPVPDSVMSER
ncbi:MAG: DUF3318 domain-containing protein [Kamptonema sp. SIO4C4]|nr:DUF3318 domain-containing protein [Kamptonema sp. SIO4C4]